MIGCLPLLGGKHLSFGLSAQSKGKTMNEKEVAELRRRVRSDKTSITRIRGAYVNEKREIISELDQSTALLSENECDQILSLLKKTLSGKVDTNLLPKHSTPPCNFNITDVLHMNLCTACTFVLQTQRRG